MSDLLFAKAFLLYKADENEIFADNWAKRCQQIESKLEELGEKKGLFVKGKIKGWEIELNHSRDIQRACLADMIKYREFASRLAENNESALLKVHGLIRRECYRLESAGITTEGLDYSLYNAFREELAEIQRRLLNIRWNHEAAKNPNHLYLQIRQRMKQ